MHLVIGLPGRGLSSVVIHEKEDKSGRGFNDVSQMIGNAGGRV